jgi:hypothetical protein
MNCSQMMFGAKVRYGITFKAGQPNFTVYIRKYYHNFKVQLTSRNLEGSKGANLAGTGQYVLTEGQDIVIQ